MSVRSKIALVLFLAVSLFVAADIALQRLSFEGRFEELAAAQAPQPLLRVVAELERQLDHLKYVSEATAARLGDPADWSDTTSAAAALPTAVAGAPVHFLLACDADGWVRQLRVLDPATGGPLQLRELPNQRLSPGHPLLRGGREERRGCWVTERGALLLNSTETASGALRITVGRFLDDSMLAEIRARTGVDVEVTLAQGRASTPEDHDAVELAVAKQAPVIERLPDGRVQVFCVVLDLGERPALLLRAEGAREVRALWAEMREYQLTSALAVAVLFPFAILWLLQWIVTGPLSRLTSHVVRIGKGGDLDARLNLRRRDEIGQLASGFDGMLEKLARSREEVVHNARLAGMSEVSAGVMHNVGNVLNSVTTSAGLARQKLKEAGLSDLRMLLDMLDTRVGQLDEYLTKDARGRHFVPCLAALVDHLEANADGVEEELVRLGHGIEHIESLVAKLAGPHSRIEVAEQIDLAEQIDAALELCQLSLDPELSVEVERAYEELPRVLLERHKLLEVLVNVIRNSLQALEAVDERERRLELRLAPEGEDCVLIEVRDSGVGIAREDLVRVFALGHTTRAGGRGLGLHLAATAAGELGGTMTAHSAGLGHGATFTLRLPQRVSVRTMVA